MTVTDGMFSTASPQGSSLITVNDTYGTIRVSTFISGGVPAPKSMSGGKRTVRPSATSHWGASVERLPPKTWYDDFVVQVLSL